MTKKILKNYFKQISVLIDKLDLEKILILKNKIKQHRKKDGKIFIFGNGGSASTANHFAVDMTKNAKIETHSISNDDLITCFSNDYGFDYWIKNAIKYYVKKNDFVIFLSVSGNSKNIINAIKCCKLKKINFFCLTGHKEKNLANKLSKNYIWVNSMSYNVVEIVHSVILFNIIDLIIGTNIYSSRK